MKTFLSLSVAIAVMISCCLTTPSARAMEIVQNHQPQAAIVVGQSESAQVQAAAKTLQKYLQKSTGAELPVSSTVGNNLNIHIGETPYVKEHRLKPGDLDQDGFILQGVDEKNFVIVGGSDWGTEFGVYDFLERYVGVRWLAGGELFTDIPQHASLDIPTAPVRQEPVFLSRRLSPAEMERDYSGKRFQSIPGSAYQMYDEWARPNRLRQRVEFHHNLLNVFPASQFGGSHPEFYPLINNKRFLPTSKEDFRWQPNFSAPGIADVAATHIEKYFSENPKATSFSLGINDSRNFDQSPETLARRGQLGGLPDEYATWINDVVAKVLLKYPEKFFGFLAYIELRTPPKNVIYNSHVIPFITYELSRWSDPQSQQVAKELATQWHARAENIGWYDYFYGMSYMTPRSYAHTEAQALRWLSQNGVKYYYAENYANFGEGPKDWVQSKLLWNPNQDVDALINDWCTHAVGEKAAPSLNRYYALWEKFWTQDLPKSSWYSRQADYMPFGITSYLLDVPQAYLDQSDRFLTEAVQLAETPQHKQRALKLQQMWQLYKASVIARQGDELWKSADLQNEAQAVEHLQKCNAAILQAQKRLQLLSDLRHDPFYGFSVYRITRSDDTRGSDWGATSLWSLLPWVNKSAQVRSGLEKIASTPAPKEPLMHVTGPDGEAPMTNDTALIANQVLLAAQGKGLQLLENSSFEGGLQSWQATGLKVSPDVAHSGGASALADGGKQLIASQKVPYEPGTYYATFSAYTPQNTSAKATLSLTAVNQLGRQRGRNLPAGMLTLKAGKWSTFIVPVTLTDLKVTDTMSLLVSVQIEGLKTNDKIYLDDVGIYEIK